MDFGVGDPVPVHSIPAISPCFSSVGVGRKNGWQSGGKLSWAYWKEVHRLSFTPPIPLPPGVPLTHAFNISLQRTSEI